MYPIRFRLLPLGLAAAVLVGSGCVSQNEVDQYRNQYRVAQEQILDLQAQLEDKDRQIALLRDAKNPNVDLQAQLADARKQRAELEAALATARDQLSRAGSTPIPVELADELEALAQQNPDLMSYDKETGAIRFRSDVTFGSGKAEVRDGAKPIISELAQVLSSSVAANYEVRVVGHTDNVPIKNAFVKQQFGDNWGLSVARAISVMKEFRTAGINQNRMSVAGYGEFRPVEPNGPKGSEANRRVEIFLAPLPAGVSMGEDNSAASDDAEETSSDSADVVPMDRPAPPSNVMDAGK